MGQESRIENGSVGFQSSRISSTYGKDRLSEPPIVSSRRREWRAYPTLRYLIDLGWTGSIHRLDPTNYLSPHFTNPIITGEGSKSNPCSPLAIYGRKGYFERANSSTSSYTSSPQVISTYTSKTAIPKRSQTIKGTGTMIETFHSYLFLFNPSLVNLQVEKSRCVTTWHSNAPCFLHWSRQVKGAYPIHVIGNPHEQKTHSQRGCRKEIVFAVAVQECITTCRHSRCMTLIF